MLSTYEAISQDVTILCEPTRWARAGQLSAAALTGYRLPAAQALVAAGREVHAIMGVVPKSCCCLRISSVPFWTTITSTSPQTTQFSWREGRCNCTSRASSQDKQVDRAFCAGPVPMMKFSSTHCREVRHTYHRASEPNHGHLALVCALPC